MSKIHDITRRSFLKTSALAAATALTPVAKAGDMPAKWAGPKCSGWSWETPPAPIAESEISKTISTDVVVIGAGLAGFTAALGAVEQGAKVVLVEKTKGWSGRGGHITAINSKLQQRLGVKVDPTEIVRRLIAWGQGRMDERLLWMFALKSADCFDWVADMAAKYDVKPALWDAYYKGPTYTEFPVTHFFYGKNVNLDYMDADAGGIGVEVLMPCLESEAKKAGVDLMYETPAVRIIREKGAPVTGIIAGKPGNYTRINAKSVVIATGCYASNEEMRKAFSPYSLRADAQIYFPTKSNTGDGHIMAMHVGGVMQKNDNHAATVHLEEGAGSYGFLHVNARGERFMNEDVNTQSKSCAKELQPHGIAWTVYDANWASDVKKQVDGNLAGGLFYGQTWQPWGSGWNPELEKAVQARHIKQGKVVVADTIEELAQKMNVPADSLKATVERYNELAAKGRDDDFGKRKELLTPIVKAPFYAGRLASSLLAMSGGLHTDPTLMVLDTEDKPIKGLYVCGAAAGDYFGSGDYPTICPGMNHGRAITFGRLAGIKAAGGDIDKAVKSIPLV